jgi:sarcosine oxidase subunit alpha
VFEEYGGWSRPAAYPRAQESLEQASHREALAVRRNVGIFDGSPLGKLEIFGPDAARFLDFLYVGTVSNLAIGRARYGVLLNENGIVVDDGIVARLAEDRFWVNTSSAGAARTAAAFEEWKQCEFPDWQVLITPVTSRWANVTIAGPRAWDWLSAAGLEAALAPASLKHMSIRDTALDGFCLRVLRASFSGELSYEMNVPSGQCEAFLERLWAVGERLEPVPYGIEALQLMRIEKGYIHVGTDTDGTTLPADIGLGEAIVRKKADFVGRRSLGRPAAVDPSRLQLVALQPVDRKTLLPVGGQIALTPPPAVSEGHVTSSALSPELGHPIALAMLRGGRQRTGQRVRVHHFGVVVEAEVVKAPFVDAEGRRLHG